MIKIYTQIDSGQKWLGQYRGCLPTFACVLGCTDTGLLPGISAAGATPELGFCFTKLYLILIYSF